MNMTSKYRNQWAHALSTLTLHKRDMTNHTPNVTDDVGSKPLLFSALDHNNIEQQRY